MSDYRSPNAPSIPSTSQPNLSRTTSNASSLRTDPNDIQEWACPICKTDPSYWMLEENCGLYRKDKLQDLLRHHVVGDGDKLSTHERLNKTLIEKGDVHQYDPAIFGELKAWWKRLPRGQWKYKEQNIDRWRNVYGMFQRSGRDGSLSVPPNPFFTTKWVRGVFVDNFLENLVRCLGLEPLNVFEVNRMSEELMTADLESLCVTIRNRPDMQDFAIHLISLMKRLAQSHDPLNSSHVTQQGQTEESIQGVGDMHLYAPQQGRVDDSLVGLDAATDPHPSIKPDTTGAIHEVDQYDLANPTSNPFGHVGAAMYDTEIDELLGFSQQQFEDYPQPVVDLWSDSLLQPILPVTQGNNNLETVHHRQFFQQPQFLQLTPSTPPLQYSEQDQRSESILPNQFLQLPPLQYSSSRKRSRSSPPRGDTRNHSINWNGFN